MKNWMTCAEFAAAKVEGLPTSGRGMRHYIKRHGWDNYPDFVRKRRGERGPIEYHLSLLNNRYRALRFVIHETSVADEIMRDKISKVAPEALHIFLQKDEVGQLKAVANARQVPIEVMLAHLIRQALFIAECVA